MGVGALDLNCLNLDIGNGAVAATSGNIACISAVNILCDVHGQYNNW